MGEQIQVSVRYGRESFNISLDESGSIRQLMECLQSLTNVLPRGQKLIFKGKILTAEMSIKEVKLTSGSKIMLMATQGVHQGPGETAKKPQAPSRRVPVVMEKKNKQPEISKMEKWKASGMVSLRETEIVEVPSDVWEVGAYIRILDLSYTLLKSLPSEVASLSNLRRLNLKGNNFEDANFSWNALSSLRLLTVLVLDDNRLTCLPSEIQHLLCLQRLLVANNGLVSVAPEIGELRILQDLDLSNNRLQQVPDSLGQCMTLMELNISKNFLTALPSSLGDLKRLKVLNLNNNALASFPASVLKGCTNLTSLSLHGNEITVEALREVDGWNEFDARRRLKYDKQIDFHVLGSADGFDEGADNKRTRHW